MRCMLFALIFCAAPSQAADIAVSLARLDCGGEPEPVSAATSSDTFDFPDLKIDATNSCYVIRHGDDILLWDTGYPMDGKPTAPKTSIVDQLKRLGIVPEKITHVGISHYHRDHTGQAAAFPHATLLIGTGDWNYVSASAPPPGVVDEAFADRRARFQPWLDGGKVRRIHGENEDVFGDGSVVMLNLPGHTPGHTGLLIRLKKTGNVLLSGDVSHFRENYAIGGIPSWNSNRADSVASLDRFKKIAKNLQAIVVIQHDARDVAKLPAFPAVAE